jgi:glycerol-3-phosphate dehydrogenase (NAD(P)+)
MIAILGAGAMGSALAVHWARHRIDVVLLATEYDTDASAAWRDHQPHPALGILLPTAVPCLPPAKWEPILASADVIAVCVSTAGLDAVLRRAAAYARRDATWILVSKGWETGSLRSPSELARAVAGADARLVTLGGPALAAEIAVGAPTALVCAADDVAAADHVAASLRSRFLAVAVTDDVPGVETSSAYKNVVAIAVGICEGLVDRLGQSAIVHTFANARAAVFAQGLVDMGRLAEARGGRIATLLGLAGAGDLFVTSLGGRNGRFGRLLGSGLTPDRALRVVGSTVEGVANTSVALALAARLSLHLPTAEAVNLALHGQLLGDEGLVVLRELFAAAVTDHHTRFTARMR